MSLISTQGQKKCCAASAPSSLSYLWHPEGIVSQRWTFCYNPLTSPNIFRWFDHRRQSLRHFSLHFHSKYLFSPSGHFRCKCIHKHKVISFPHMGKMLNMTVERVNGGKNFNGRDGAQRHKAHTLGKTKHLCLCCVHTYSVYFREKSLELFVASVFYFI